ncbi:alpha/beta hydrolase [Nocardioides jiangxiensis]|uniref:Alpha/beta hydrolase n=1 Tax=Nocardioides jiangxiensis TaxID=3064524 RepID=A0ABT9B0Z8_9ACTN|nr:alpha/beta hydrolase [Nocardioides sp. WY-20]MDO7868509.1 alpha/beta hydrolase [Nocardioides sp. WY-20]
MKRALPVVLVVIALVFPMALAVVVLVRDQRGDDSSTATTMPPRPDQPGSRTSPSPALARFYAQKLEWSRCRTGGDECATLEVPLDYRRPAGRTIGIAVLRNPADRSPGTARDLLVNPGGPGAPGTDLAATDSPFMKFPDTLYEHFNVVGFDPRGTGSSEPVDCLSDSELDAYTAGDPDPDTPAEVEEYVAAADSFGPGCQQRSGDLYRHLGTHDAARDMDVLRAALGDAEVDYLGVSYGTKLGATYADLFPKRVGRMVLDGADPPLTALDTMLEQAHGFQVALEAYVDDCIAGGDCYLGSSRPAALQKVRDFLDEVDARPLRVGTRELTEGGAFLGIIYPLYSKDYWPYLTDALEAALKGDGRQLLAFADLYNGRKQGGGYQDNSAEAILAINCDDDPSSLPASRIPALFPRFAEKSPTFGRIFAWGMVGCGSLGPAEDEKRQDWHLDARGAAPIVVIGTTRDPATPLAWARKMASDLASGVLITRDGDGHGGFGHGNSCVDDAVERYLIDGTVPTDNLSC